MKHPRLLRISIVCALLSSIPIPVQIARAANGPAPAGAPTREEQTMSIIQALVDDMLPYAKKGDKDLQTLLETQKLNKSVDWNALAKDPKKAETLLVTIAQELVRLAPTNEHAKAIVQKYNIQMSPPKS